MPPVEHRLSFLEKIRDRSEQAGTNIFMMVDPVRLGSKDLQGRTDVVKRFHQLVDQARVVGAKYLKVFLDVGDRTSDLQATRAVDGVKRLADYAAMKQVSVAVEPSAGASRNGLWLARVIEAVDQPTCGSLPDFGKLGKFDKCASTTALVPSASVIAAKSYAINEAGLELQSDYPRLFPMIVDAGYGGIVAIQYGGQHSEVAAVKATQKLLQRLQESFSV